MKYGQWLIVISVMAGLAGCTSPRVRYHTLVSPDAVTTPISPANFVIEVLPVGVPAQLDTQQVVIRQSDSRVAVLDNDRWLSPLGDELQTALSSRMTQRLNTVDVAGLARDNSQPVVRILVQIRRFDSWPGKAISLDANWSLSTIAGDKRRRLVCKSQLSQKISTDSTQMFSAWQTLMDRMANKVAQTATAWMTTQANCRQP